jgi:pimeloyl-ACP methyl ester carboxylesterase
MGKEIFEPHGRHECLVVIFHALKGSPEAMRDVIDAVKASVEHADILVPPLPYGGFWGKLSTYPPALMAEDVAKRIDRAVAEQQSYRRIIFVGYSFGAMIARKVAIVAHGERPNAPFEAELKESLKARTWAGKIERMVLLAGFSRGWSAATTRDWQTAALWTLGAWFGELWRLITLRELSLSQIRQGSPFVVQTRLQWLALVSPPPKHEAPELLAEPPATRIETVQLLGAVDDLVAPDDSVDWAVDTVTDAFALVEVPGAGHGSAATMARPTPDEERALRDGTRPGCERSIADVVKWGTEKSGAVPAKEGVLTSQVRWMLFGWALTKPLNDPEFERVKITRDEMADTPALHRDPHTTDVVFVIHGIRDRGFWTHKIARVIKREVKHANEGLAEDQKRHVQSFTGSYGYFAMVPFILPWVRRWKTDWLMDRYTEARAIYPHARFSYVGHSNGTYLLAKALQDYPAASFDRVVFAGSVVRKDYDWRQFLEPQHANIQPRVNEVLNYVATRDWVVALLPKGFQPLKFVFDVGSAGHDGFKQSRTIGAVTPPKGLYEARCVKGSHSAGISETQWDDIANFVVNGKRPPKGKSDQDFQDGRWWPMVLGGWVSSAFVLLLLWLVIGTGVSLLRSIDGAGSVELASLGNALAVVPRRLVDTVLAAPEFAVDTVKRAPEIAVEFARAIGGAIVSVFWTIVGAIGALFYGLYAAIVHGRIETFSDLPQVGGSGLRAAVFAAYCWVIYLFVTRF